MKEHNCNKEPKLSVEQWYDMQNGFCGEAFCKVEFVDGDRWKGWIVENGEYCSPINFCPWCGVKLA